MDPVLVGLIGVIIGGIFTSFGNWLANHFALKREEKLWQRQEQQRAKDREAELKKAIISQLQQAYANSISSLTAYSAYTSELGRARDPKEAAKRLEEAGKWLSYIVVYHYDNQSEEFASFIQLYNILDGLNAPQAANLRNLVIAFASNDPRLKIDLQ